MGALVHNQSLYRFRSWELSKNIIFDIFSIETPLLKVDILHNIDIVRVSPLMIDGYRYLLNDITRYAYFFFNYNTNTTLYIKTTSLINKNLSWHKVINFMQYICIYSLLNNLKRIFNEVYLKNLFILKLNKIKTTNSIYLYIADNIDLLNLKVISLFSFKNFGYLNLNFMNRISIQTLNNMRINILKSKLVSNQCDLELNLSKIINYQMHNKKYISNIQDLTYVNKTSILYFLCLFLNLCFAIILNKIRDLNLNLFAILKHFRLLYNFFCNKNFLKINNLKFISNFENYKYFNLNNFFSVKVGRLFFNNNLQYNLNFSGLPIKIFKCSYFESFLFFINIVSFSSFFIKEKINNLEKVLFTVNFTSNLDDNVGLGLKLIIYNILNLNKNKFINAFSKFIHNVPVIMIRGFAKNLKRVFDIVSKWFYVDIKQYNLLDQYNLKNSYA